MQPDPWGPDIDAGAPGDVLASLGECHLPDDQLVPYDGVH
jgi:hypothetical protein